MQTWPNFGYTVAYSGGGGAGAITVSVTEARSTGVAPLSVFFDATATTAVSLTSNPFHELVYVWSFGDTAGGATWTNGARSGLSKNAAFGPVASHVFETAGTYTVTLTVFHFDSLGVMSSASTTKTITVTAADTVFASDTVCFSTSGNFTGAPAGSTQVTTSDYGTALNSYKATKKRFLFCKGETFTSSANVYMDVDGPILIGAYGSGAKPIWQVAASGTALNWSNSSTPQAGRKDYRLMDITIDGLGNAASRAVNAEGGVNQLLHLRVDLKNLYTGFEFSKDVLNYYNGDGNPSHSGHTVWNQLAIVECSTATPVAGGATTQAYIWAEQFTFLGNDFDANQQGHVIRTSYLGGGVMSHNNLKNPITGKHAWYFHAPIQGDPGVTADRYTEKVVFSENFATGGGADWILYLGYENSAYDERMRNVIVERNYLLASASTQVAIATRPSLSLATFRNNIANLSLRTSGDCFGFSIGGGSPGPVATDINYSNNTTYSATTNAVYGVVLDATTTNATIANNLLYAPSSTGSQFISGSGASGLSTATNTSNGQIATTPAFSNIPATSATKLAAGDFKPTGSTYVVNGGTYTACVLNDADRVDRTGTMDIGALQP